MGAVVNEQKPSNIGRISLERQAGKFNLMEVMLKSSYARKNSDSSEVRNGNLHDNNLTS